MTDPYPEDPRKELRVLLGQIQANPSRDWTRERDRIAVLNKLIVARGQAAAA